jgi:hypothetical protein
MNAEAIKTNANLVPQKQSNNAFARKSHFCIVHTLAICISVKYLKE